MIAAITFACVLGSAVAFAPAPSARSSRVSTTMMAAERSKSLPFLMRPAKLDGSMAGDEGFDPLGLSNINFGFDLYWMREAEIKHCRIAMLAFVGQLAADAGFVLPGQPSGKPSADLFWESFDRNPGPIFAAFLFIGVLELVGLLAINEGRKGDRAPGYFGFNPLGFGKTDASMKDLAVKEVRNGRLAMWAAAGILLQESSTHSSALSF